MTVIYLLLDIDPKRGRLAVREPRATDRLIVIKDLINLSNITVTLDLTSLSTSLAKVQSERDRLAHGIWLRDQSTNEILLRVTKGTLQTAKGRREKTKRVISPEGIIFGVSECRKLTEDIREAAETIELLGFEIDEALRASRKKPSGRHQLEDRYQDHTQARFRPLLGSPLVRAPYRREE